MTTPIPDVGEAEFAELMQRINDLVRDTRIMADELLKRIHQAAAHAPAALGAGYREATKRVTRLLARIFIELDKILNRPGWPPGLLTYGGYWADHVGRPVSMVAGDADPDQSPALGLWTGAAADAYREALGPQQRAITAVKRDMVEAVHDCLTAMSVAIVTFWAAVLAALVGLLGGLAAAITAVGSGPGAAVAPYVAAAACAAFIVGLSSGAAVLLATAAVQEGNLRGALGDYLAIRDGHWPTVRAAHLADGTLRDAGPGGPDDTDWHVR